MATKNDKLPSCVRRQFGLVLVWSKAHVPNNSADPAATSEATSKYVALPAFGPKCPNPLRRCRPIE